MYVKWRERSYLHCDWIDENKLEVCHPGMLRNFWKRQQNGEQATDGADDEEMDEDELKVTHGVRPEWCEIDRVIGRRFVDKDSWFISDPEYLKNQ